MTRQWRLHLPWWGLIVVGGALFMGGLLFLCFVMIGYLIISNQNEANAPIWLGLGCMGPGIVLVLAGVPPVIWHAVRIARYYLRRDWVSTHDLREEYRR
jgi:hypothetical protein